MKNMIHSDSFTQENVNQAYSIILKQMPFSEKKNYKNHTRIIRISA